MNRAVLPGKTAARAGPGADAYRSGKAVAAVERDASTAAAAGAGSSVAAGPASSCCDGAVTCETARRDPNRSTGAAATTVVGRDAGRLAVGGYGSADRQRLRDLELQPAAAGAAVDRSSEIART